jgi:hypothetical protein
MSDANFFEGFEVISTYTRAQAIEDGVLVDCSKLAREAGFKYPVALERDAWEKVVSLTEAAKAAGCDETGRLWDVLVLLHFAVRSAKGTASLVRFAVSCVTTSRHPDMVQLVAEVGPGDRAEPVITISLGA